MWKKSRCIGELFSDKLFIWMSRIQVIWGADDSVTWQQFKKIFFSYEIVVAIFGKCPRS